MVFSDVLDVIFLEVLLDKVVCFMSLVFDDVV